MPSAPSTHVSSAAGKQRAENAALGMNCENEVDSDLDGAKSVGVQGFAQSQAGAVQQGDGTDNVATAGLVHPDYMVPDYHLQAQVTRLERRGWAGRGGRGREGDDR